VLVVPDLGVRDRLLRLFRRKRRWYLDVFGASDEARTESQRRVLGELARYAGLGRSHFARMGKPDALALARLEGRREIVLMVMEALHMSEERLARLAHEEGERDD